MREKNEGPNSPKYGPMGILRCRSRDSVLLARVHAAAAHQSCSGSFVLGLAIWRAEIFRRRRGCEHAHNAHAHSEPLGVRLVGQRIGLPPDICLVRDRVIASLSL